MHLETSVQLAQPGLTEANLQRHNQTEHIPLRPSFTGKSITVNNRWIVQQKSIWCTSLFVVYYLQVKFPVHCDRCICWSHDFVLSWVKGCILWGMCKVSFDHWLDWVLLNKPVHVISYDYRLSVQGMGSLFSCHLPGNSDVTPTSLDFDELSTMKRYSVSDSLVISLLRGVRMCL